MRQKLGIALALIGVACAVEARAADNRNAGANAERGAALIAQYGCGSCHTIPGIAGARGQVGPPLTQLARRVYIAGMLRNTPDNLALWISDPQGIVPGNVMPNMGIDAQNARDIAAYLATLQ
jgi:putative membrane protein